MPGCSAVWSPPGPGAGACSGRGGLGGGGSAGRGRLAFGLRSRVEAAVAEEEAGDELRVRDERRVRPRGKEREAWEAMAKANSRLRPARTPERSTNEPAPPSASSSMDGRGGSYPLSPALTCLPSLAGVRVCLHRQLIRLTTRGGRRSWNWIQPNWEIIGYLPLDTCGFAKERSSSLASHICHPQHCLLAISAITTN